jgi:hypothetical protein
MLVQWIGIPLCPRLVLFVFFGVFIGRNSTRITMELAIDCAKQEYEAAEKAYKKKLNEEFDKFYEVFEKLKDPTPPC